MPNRALSYTSKHRVLICCRKDALPEYAPNFALIPTWAPYLAEFGPVSQKAASLACCHRNGLMPQKLSVHSWWSVAFKMVITENNVQKSACHGNKTSTGHQAQLGFRGYPSFSQCDAKLSLAPVHMAERWWEFKELSSHYCAGGKGLELPPW